jgi:hypothetical protein
MVEAMKEMKMQQNQRHGGHGSGTFRIATLSVEAEQGRISKRS